MYYGASERASEWGYDKNYHICNNYKRYYLPWPIIRNEQNSEKLSTNLTLKHSFEYGGGGGGDLDLLFL